MARRASSQTNKPLAIFATLLVVAGVVAVVAVSSEFKNATTPQSLKNGAASSTQATVAYASGTIIMVNENAATLVRLDAMSERVPAEQFSARFDGQRLPIEGSSVANGTKAYFHLPGASSTSALPSPDGGISAQLTEGKNGIMALNVMHGDETPQPIALRDERGHALQNVMLLGWLDSRSLAFAGVVTSTATTFRVNVDGTITALAPLPPNMIWVEARNGEIWYVTAEAGEGIETAPRGPSELHRITADGADVLAARDELHVFLTEVPGPGNRLAFTTDDGQSFLLNVGDPGSRVALGKERPLLFLPNESLLVRDGYDLAVFDPGTRVSRKLSSVPEGQVSVFFLP